MSFIKFSDGEMKSTLTDDSVMISILFMIRLREGHWLKVVYIRVFSYKFITMLQVIFITLETRIEIRNISILDLRMNQILVDNKNYLKWINK